VMESESVTQAPPPLEEPTPPDESTYEEAPVTQPEDGTLQPEPYSEEVATELADGEEVYTEGSVEQVAPEGLRGSEVYAEDAGVVADPEVEDLEAEATGDPMVEEIPGEELPSEPMPGDPTTPADVSANQGYGDPYSAPPQEIEGLTPEEAQGPGYETDEVPPAETEQAELLDPTLVPATGDDFVFNGDMSAWSEPGTPEEWEPWVPPTPPSPESMTSMGCCTDWGNVEAEWAETGGQLAEYTEPEQDLSSMVGPGHKLDVHWAYQGDTNYCGLYSVNSVLSEQFGQPVDINEMVNRAAANGWLVFENGEVKGIKPEHIDDVFASYGVGSHNFGGPGAAPVGDGDAWQALNDALTNDQRVVVGVDGGEFDRGGDEGVPGTLDMDHFVAVTGVDYAKGVVTMNDSARSAGLEVPLSVFLESWRDSNFSMTVTDASIQGDNSAQPPEGAQLAPDAPDFAMLGMTLHPTPGVADPADAMPLSAMPEEGVASTGSWWSSATSPTECCVVPEAVTQMPPEEQPAPLEFADASGEKYALAGMDTTGNGQSDLAGMDANGDDQVDTWVFDTTGNGCCDLMYIDGDGDGQPDSISYARDTEGTWAEPLPLETCLNCSLPGQEPGSPLVVAPGVDTPQLDALASIGTPLDPGAISGQPGPMGDDETHRLRASLVSSAELVGPTEQQVTALTTADMWWLRPPESYSPGYVVGEKVAATWPDMPRVPSGPIGQPTAARDALFNAYNTGPTLASISGQMNAQTLNATLMGPPNTLAAYTSSSGTRFYAPGDLPLGP